MDDGKCIVVPLRKSKDYKFIAFYNIQTSAMFLHELYEFRAA